MKVKLLQSILFILLIISMVGCNNNHQEQIYSVALAQTLPSVEVTKAFIEKQKNVKQEKVDASDIESIKSEELLLLYAYYTANSRTSEGLLRWYISATGGSLAGYIFSLGDIETINGIEKVSWREVSNNAARVDVVNSKVIIANIANNLTHTFKDWGLGVTKNYESIQEDIELIRNTTVNVRWWFFQAPNNSWYIVDNASHIYKFETKNGEYDWQSVDTSGENFELYIEGGKRKFRVVPHNAAPIADAGADITTSLNQTVTIRGTGTDSDGTIESYQWKFGNIVVGTTASFEYTPTGAILPGGRVDVLTLIVTDNKGASSSDTVNVTVTPETTQQRPFITTWKTNNNGWGENNEIKIPAYGNGYNYNVDWGDGKSDSGLTTSIIHTYDVEGTYTVKISGDYPWFYHSFSSYNNNKLLSVEQWGDIEWVSMVRAFKGCNNVVLNATDKPNLSKVTSLSGMFMGATSMNQPIEDWNTSTITDMTSMFRSATSFNQPLEKWDVSNVTTMESMFMEATAFNQPLAKWNTSSLKSTWIMFWSASSFNQTLGDWNLSSIESMENMFQDITLSVANYDDILSKWSQQPLNNNVKLGVGNSQYSSGIPSTSRQHIIDTFNWEITDGGQVADTTSPSIPTLTTPTPTTTTDNNITVEVNGEVGAKVYVNGVEVATVGADGKVSITLPLNSGDNSFSVTLRDDADNESEALSFSVTRNDVPLATKISFNIDDSRNAIGSYSTHNYTQDVVLSKDNTKAFIADGYSGIKVIDITNLASPTQLGSYNTSGSSYGVVLSEDGTKIYVADGSSGLQILDVSNPTSPILLGSYDTAGTAYGIAISNDETKVFIADSSSGLQIIDISNPNTPTLLGTYDTSGSARRLTLSNDNTKVFLADESSGLQIIDISNPSSPTLLSTYNTNGSAYDVALSKDNTKAFIADGDRGLQIVDISNLNAPTLLGTYDTSGSARGIMLLNDTKAFIADNSAGLQIIDISNLNTPTLIKTYNTSAFARAVTLSANSTKAFIADYTGGIQILDITNPVSPTQLATYNTNGYTENIILSSNKTKAFVSNGYRGLKIIDVTNPLSPTILSSLTTNGTAYNVALSNDETIAFVANGSAGLQLIDITNLSSPILLESYDTSSSVYNVALSNDGTKAFLANANNGLQIIDIHNPNSLISLGSYDTSGSAQDVVLSKDETKAFIADYLGGIKIVDISNTSAPTLINSYNLGGISYDIEISEDNTKIYVANLQGLKILDISDLSSIRLLGSYTTKGYTKSVTLSVDGTKAYIDDDAVLDVLDISNPSSPRRLNSYNTNNYVKGIACSNDDTKAYIANYTAGLSIIDLTVDTLFEVQNFENSNIELKISSNQEIPLSMSITANRDDIITIGNYKSELSYEDYNATTVNIPISSIEGALGQTIVTVTLNYGDKNVTRTVYFNVYPTSESDVVAPTPPTLTTTPSTETTNSEITLEVNGEVGAKVYVNGVEVATIGADGKVSVTLPLNSGDNSFSITLRDDVDNESEALSFSVTRNEAQRPFIITVKTDNEGVTEDNQFKIGTRAESGTYNYTVDCDGDGVNEATGVSGDYICTYNTAGTYTIKIGGEFPQIYFDYSGYDNKKLLSIEQWGDIEWKSMKRAFFECSNLVGNFTDKPNLSNVMDLTYMFYFAKNFNQNIGDWNTTTITNMEDMFAGAEKFNGNIGNWDVSNVINMRQMFNLAKAFNQDIGDWNTSNVKTMFAMFSMAYNFNQDIGKWDVSSVTNMNWMFEISPFNQDISEWDVSSVTGMNNMFNSATAFNQDIGEWDVSKVTDMRKMFKKAFSFNKNISHWNVKNVTDMSEMFYRAIIFNQDLSQWNISKVTNMTDMFKDSNLSTQNYDAILNTWNQLDLQRDVPFGAGTIKYSSDAEASRQSMIDDYGWTISDGGLDEVVLTADLPNQAVDTAVHPIVRTYGDYTFEIRTDGVAPTASTQNTVTLFGKTSLTGLADADTITFNPHGEYASGTNFQLIIKNSNGDIVAKSGLMNFTTGTTDIGFGTIQVP